MKRTLLGALTLLALTVRPPAAAQGGGPNLGDFVYFSIQPTATLVKRGQSITLRIQYCGPESRVQPDSGGDDDLTPLSPAIVTCRAGPSVRADSVTASAGTVTQVDNTTLKYTAPTTPRASPVTITATYNRVNGTTAKVLLVAKVVIDVVREYQGTLAYRFRNGAAGIDTTATVTWTLNETAYASGVLMYSPTGTMKTATRTVACAGTGSGAISTGLMLVDDQSQEYEFAGGSTATFPMACTNGDSDRQGGAVGSFAPCQESSIPLADIALLKGSCREADSSVTWQFQAVK